MLNWPVSLIGFLSGLDLKSNLISEAIGILVTVFLVDRVLQWRKRRRWHQVRHRFLVTARVAGGTIVDAWRTWLLNVYGVLVERFGERTPNGAPFKEIEALLGFPVGSELNRFLKTCDSKDIGKAASSLEAYLRTRLPQPTDSSWVQLTSDLQRPVQQLNDLVSRYVALVEIDPDFALPVVSLSLCLDVISEEVPKYRNVDDGWRYHPAAQDLSGIIAQDFKATCELWMYFRRYGEQQTSWIDRLVVRWIRRHLYALADVRQRR